MTIPVISATIGDLNSNKNFTAIREVLCGGVSIDNFNFAVLDGTTATEVDSQKIFAHSMSPRPVAWFPLIGDIYVQEISDKYIDVRATKPDVNFKIIIVGGKSVTGESLTAVGSSGYKTTTEVIQSTPTISIEEITDLTIHIKPKVIKTSIGPIVDYGTGIRQIINDANYYYITTISTNVLVRLGKSDGIVSILNLPIVGVGGVGAMILHGTDIYITESGTGGALAGSFNINIVDTNTFTVTSTITVNCPENVADISDLLIEEDSVLLGVTNLYYTHKWQPLYGGSAKLSKITKSLGVWNPIPTTILLKDRVWSTYTYGAHKIISDTNWGNRLFICGDSVAYTTYQDTGDLYEVDKNTFTLTNTYPLQSKRGAINMVSDGYYLYIPVYCTSVQQASQVGTFAAALMIFDMVSNTWVNTYAIPLWKQTGDVLGNIQLMSDGYLYIAFSNLSNTIIIRVDTIDGSFIIGIFDFESRSRSLRDNLLITDATTGELQVIGNGSFDSFFRGFEGFIPDFSDYEGIS